MMRQLLKYKNDSITEPRILLKFNAKKITHLKADANYTYLISSDGTKVLSAYSLKVFQDLFKNEDFIRIDRSNLVKRTFIKTINQCSEGDSITLKDNTRIKIPRRKRERLKIDYPQIFKMTEAV